MRQTDPQKLRIVPKIQVLKEKLDANNEQFKVAYVKCMKKYGNH